MPLPVGAHPLPSLLAWLQIRSQLELRLHEVNRARRRRNPAGGHHHRRDRLFGGGGGGGDDDAQAPLWWRVGRRVGSSRVVVQSQRCAALGASTCLYPSSHAPARCFYPPRMPPCRCAALGAARLVALLSDPAHEAERNTLECGLAWLQVLPPLPSGASAPPFWCLCPPSGACAPPSRCLSHPLPSLVAWLQALLFVLVWPGQTEAQLAYLCHASLALTLVDAACTGLRLAVTRAAFWLRASNLADCVTVGLPLPLYALIYTGAPAWSNSRTDSLGGARSGPPAARQAASEGLGLEGLRLEGLKACRAQRCRLRPVPDHTQARSTASGRRAPSRATSGPSCRR